MLQRMELDWHDRRCDKLLAPRKAFEFPNLRRWRERRMDGLIKTS